MSTRLVNTILNLVALVALAGSAWAVPPSPEAKQKFIEEGTWEHEIANLRAFEESQPADMYEISRALHLDKFRASMALGTEAVDTIRVCVLLVDFPDFKYNSSSYSYPGGTLNCLAVGTPAKFDSMLFSVRGQDTVSNPTGSMTDFYLENSYGQYFVQGDVYGWYTVPQNYSYYESYPDGAGQDGLGGGGAVLAHDAVMAADIAGVNFAPYRVLGTTVPAVIIIHAGPGAEQGVYGIWSHRSNMSGSVTRDGVTMSGYTMQPEERAGENSIVHVGVFCHEWGHVLGVPDWYDTQYNDGSDGLGEWCLMASGSWNNNGRSPAHINGWSKGQVGFLDLQVLTQNMNHVTIPQVETSPVVFMLKEDPVPGHSNTEWWVVENRQQVGFDAALPGQGLLIYHYDALGSQNRPDRYKLALEEADGRRDLALTASSGQASDPFPGSPTNNRNFFEFTVPDSRSNDGDLTGVSVLNISDSDSLMYADLNVTYAMPWPVLAGDSLTITDNAPGGNGDGSFVQGETLDIYLEVLNQMKMTHWPTLHLDLGDPVLQIVNNDRSMTTTLSPIYNAENFEPIRVFIPDDFISSIVTFRFTITSDSLTNSHDRSFTNTFEFEIPIGKTQILLVDDDNNRGDEYWYTAALNRLGLPFELWDKYTNGSPDYQSLSEYRFVLWMTGSYYPTGGIPGGVLTPDDVTFIKELLDHGGNLLIGSPSVPTQLATLDSAFQANYLHANLAGSNSRRYYLGDTANVVGGGLRYKTMPEALWIGTTPTLSPTNGGRGAFITTTSLGGGNYGTCGVTYDGSYRTVLLSFGVEFLSDNTINGYSPKDSLIMRALQFFVRGSATDVDDEPGGPMLPDKFALEQNYPNPFNPSTTILYSIAPGDPVLTNLAIFNVLGQKVATLVDEIQGPGAHSVMWEGKDDNGAKVASGVYFYRLIHGELAEARKMILLK